jgi:putative ABC transport system ATP-binding protein
MTLFLLVGDTHLVNDIPVRIVFNGPAGTIESGDEAGDEPFAAPAPGQGARSKPMEARP